MASTSNDSINGLSSDVSTAILPACDALTTSEPSSSIASSSSVATAVESTPHATCFYDASTLQRQYFAFPKTMIEYIAMNPASPKCYQKIIQACKYFFARNPIIVIPSLININCRDEWHNGSSRFECKNICPACDGWKLCFYVDFKRVHFYDPQLSLKHLSGNLQIWPTKSISTLENDRETPSNALSALVPRLYRSDIVHIFFAEPTISLNELKFLGPKVEAFSFYWPVINAETGSVLNLEEIIAVLPKLKKLNVSIQRERIFHPASVPRALDIPSLQTFIQCYIDRDPDTFDIEKFCDSMIKNKNIEYNIKFHPFIPQELKDRIDVCNTRLSNETYENGTKRPVISVMTEGETAISY